MENPKVSFVIPCYKLAHLLTECIDSILSQSFTDFEILIMNDKSPDNTAEVASSYSDHRVVHIQNETNLGHLRNYNHGISLSRGKYVWLISADDYLRSSDILEKYVSLMDSNPNVGYSVCPGLRVKSGQEMGIIGSCGFPEGIVRGRDFLVSLLDSNFVLAASAMVRRDCYDKFGMFPLEANWKGIPVDMGWLGDWYLWCIFALHYDVGWFPEPMVCYRDHDLSMTTNITRDDTIAKCASSDVAMLWMVRGLAQEASRREVSEDCLIAIANEYKRQGGSKRYRSGEYRLSRKEFERTLCRSTESEKEREWIRASFFEGVADRLIACGKRSSAKRFYLASLKKDNKRLKVYTKFLLLSLGRAGTFLRGFAQRIREVGGNPARDWIGIIFAGKSSMNGAAE